MNALNSFFAKRSSSNRQSSSKPESKKNIYQPIALSETDAAASYHVGHKDILARKLVSDYISLHTPTIGFLLERMLDIRLCSLITYHLCTELFGSYGTTFLRDNPELGTILGMRLLPMPSLRLADTSGTGIFPAPVKFRGFGYPVTSPGHTGHQFQINLCAFAEPHPRLAVTDWKGGNFEPVKGLKHIGTDDKWEIFEVNPNLTDDMTAILIDDNRDKVQVEVCHILPDGTMPMIYRFSNLPSDIEFGNNQFMNETHSAF